MKCEQVAWMVVAGVAAGAILGMSYQIGRLLGWWA